MTKEIDSEEIRKEREKKAMKRIEELMKEIDNQIESGEAPEFELPLRGKGNAVYNPEKKMILMGKKKTRRRFLNTAHTRKFAQTMLVAEAAYNELLKKGKTGTIRDLYYSILRTIPGTKIKTVDDQKESNLVSVDLEVALGLLREDLNLKAEKNGAVAGNVVIEDRGDIIDWSKMGSGGWAIPSMTGDIVFKKVDAKFVLYVEKTAIWERLNEDKVWKKLNCIILATQGQATRGARVLLRRLSEEHNLPVYIFTDADPWGWYIYSAIKYGSMALSHATEKLGVPKAKFMGMTMEDIEKYGLQKYTIKLNQQDIKRAHEISKYPWFQSKQWQNEIQKILKNGYKAELQALSKYGVEFISEKYIPEKIKKKEYIE